MIFPSPRQRGQAFTLTIWPSIVWRTDRTSPRPLQVGQVLGSVPGSAPFPPHVSQAPRTVNSSSFSVPLTASSELIRRSYRRADPEFVGRGGAGLWPSAAGRPAAGSTPEERVEDVRETAEALEARPPAGAT